MSRTKLVLLGTGIPNVEPDRAESSSAVVVDGRAYIVDCGAGIKQRIGRAVADGHEALRPGNLDTLFITHLHPDHTNGLPEFIVSGWIFGRRGPLKVFGPKGVAKLVHGLVELYQPGISEHLHHGPIDLTELKIEATEISAGIVYHDDLVEVEAFSVPHGTLETYAYKFKTPDKVIVFSADTCPSPQMVEKAKGCDILVHEVYSEAGLKGRTDRWNAYMRRVHTSGGELGRIAKEAQPGKLVLNHHILGPGVRPDDLIAEIRNADYQGEIVYGRDMEVIN